MYHSANKTVPHHRTYKEKQKICRHFSLLIFLQSFDQNRYLNRFQATLGLNVMKRNELKIFCLETLASNEIENAFTITTKILIYE